MDKRDTKLLNKLFTLCGLPEDPQEPEGAVFFPTGLSPVPLVQRVKREQEVQNNGRSLLESIETNVDITKRIKGIEDIPSKNDKTERKNIMGTDTYKCIQCGKANLTFDDMAKDNSRAKGLKSYCKVCVRGIESAQSKVRRDTRIVVDFREVRGGKEMMEAITKRAEDNCRTPSAEIIFMLKSAGILSCSTKEQ